MRRRSRAGGKSPNAQAPKAAARKSRIAPKAVRPRSASTANLEIEVARLPCGCVQIDCKLNFYRAIQPFASKLQEELYDVAQRERLRFENG